MLRQTEASRSLHQFCADVSAGLTKSGQKELPSKYLYDEVGSRLFDVITALPEYGLTRAEERILRRYSREIVARLPHDLVVAELGSGSGKKTRWILEALGRRRPTAYFPIEISSTALDMCQREVSDIDSVTMVGLERDYLDGLLEVVARRREEQRLLVLFLGSTIGNFDQPAAAVFLREIRLMMEPGDALLLGADLEKPLPKLVAAYDDPLGVTAAFNLNLLARINRELDADFVLSQFEHLARFNGETHSIEMHVRSKRAQTATIGKADLSVTLQEDETIWTESSHKYLPGEIRDFAKRSSFRCDAQWVDEEWAFSENLLIAMES